MFAECRGRSGECENEPKKLDEWAGVCVMLLWRAAVTTRVSHTHTPVSLAAKSSIIFCVSSPSEQSVF